MVLGLSAWGKVPTSWSAMPLAERTRWVLVQVQLAVLVFCTDAELL